MRRSRTDSKLGSLPVPQRDTVVAWMLDEGLSYDEVSERLRAEWSVQASRQTIGRFYYKYCAPLRLRRAAEAANALPGLAGEAMDGWDAASVGLVQQTYFELLAAPVADPKLVAVFGVQLANIRREKLEREKLRFQRQKAAAGLRLQRRAQSLARTKFQFSAAEVALKEAAELKTIAADRSLDHNAKIEAVRKRLFPQAFQPTEGQD